MENMVFYIKGIGGIIMLQKKGMELPIDTIRPNPEQPRKYFAEEELNDLTNSIAEYGVLQPIIVKKDKTGGYFLIAGERRLRAAKLAGLLKIPAVIKEFDDRDSAMIAVIENVQRENLSYIEEAYAYKRLIDEYGLTQGELAEKIGKKQSTISNKMRILSLPENIQQKLVENQLTERHGRALLKLDDPLLCSKVLDKVIQNNLNVKQTEQLIEDILMKAENLQRQSRKIGYVSYKIYLNTIKKAFAQIHDIEQEARIYEDDKGEYMEVKILIPKKRGCFT